MLTHLHTKGPAPPEYIELILCRDMYHCTPNELADVPLEKVIAHLICRNIETEWLNEKYKT
jgi:hypothetical protein